jgi:hypothetical protein
MTECFADQYGGEVYLLRVWAMRSSSQKANMGVMVYLLRGWAMRSSSQKANMELLQQAILGKLRASLDIWHGTRSSVCQGPQMWLQEVRNTAKFSNRYSVYYVVDYKTEP